MHDVIVIGGGPSGLNAARRLAEDGLDVLLLERKSTIGKNIACTGIIGKEAFRKFDISKDSILTEIKKIKMISPFGTSFEFEHPQSFACVVEREKFDEYLADKAEAEGAEIKLCNQVVDIQVNGDCVEVLAERGEKYDEKYSAQIAIIATGINYELNKKLGLGCARDFLNAAQVEMQVDNIDCTNVYIGRDIAAGAFAWTVPIGENRVRVGLMTEENLGGCFRHFIEKFYPDRLDDSIKNRIKLKPVAQGLLSRTYGDRIIALGEAAGQVKTTTGGGIYFGMLCSEIASSVILKSFKKGCFSARSLAEYEKSWKKEIQKEILIGYYARKICGKLSDMQIEKIFKIAKNNGVIRLIRDEGNFDWHSELILAFLKKNPFFKIISDKM